VPSSEDVSEEGSSEEVSSEETGSLSVSEEGVSVFSVEDSGWLSVVSSELTGKEDSGSEEISGAEEVSSTGGVSCLPAPPPSSLSVTSAAHTGATGKDVQNSAAQNNAASTIQVSFFIRRIPFYTDKNTVIFIILTYPGWLDNRLRGKESSFRSKNCKLKRKIPAANGHGDKIL
jgi:hypothetical protein